MAKQSKPAAAKPVVTEAAARAAELLKPLEEIDYTGVPEIDTIAETSALLAGMKERNQAEQKRIIDATDSEYWFALCFHTRAEKEAFLKALGWIDLGDKYLDGTAVAERLGVDL